MLGMNRQCPLRLGRQVFGVFLVALFCCGSASAELILTAPPRETAEDGEKLYGPLAKHLSELLAEPVVYQHPKTWRNYTSKMKKDKYDIIFDGPHFAAWRIENLSNAPSAKLPGALQFVLVVRNTDTGVKKPTDLIGSKICTLPPPNLGAVTLYSMYPNPVRQPTFVLVQGGMKEITQSFNEGKCRGAMLRKQFYENKLPESARAGMLLVTTSQALTNQGFTVSKKVSKKKQALIMESLTQGEGVKVAKPIFSRFNKKADAFVAAQPTDYVKHNLLKDNFIFGW